MKISNFDNEFKEKKYSKIYKIIKYHFIKKNSKT